MTSGEPAGLAASARLAEARPLGPLEAAEQRESVSYALLISMERLTASERAVFVLRQAFCYRYTEIAAVLGRTEASCRQLYRRAIQKLGTPVRRFRPQPARWRQLTEQFMAAAVAGDVAGIERLLAADAVCVTDGEGSGLPAALKPVTGRSRVAWFFAWLAAKHAATTQASITDVNGQPAVLVWQGATLLAVIVPEYRDTAIGACTSWRAL